jgi:Immunity protein 26
MKRLVSLNGGEIFAIPLFLSDIPENIRITKDKFEGRGKEFAFCRIISDEQGGGYFAEVFNLIGSLNQNLESIINSERLFRPISILATGIYKQRWKKIHVQKDYDKERDSKYSEIQLIEGAGDDLYLWQNGKRRPISREESKRYEEWEIWRATHLEKRIIKELFNK